MANIEDTVQVNVSGTWKPCSAMQLFVVMPPSIVDSYSESNQNTGSILRNDSNTEVGQSFTGDGGVLNSVKFYCYKSGSPTGNVSVKIYAETHATAYGTDSLPTGAALATSDLINVTTFPTSYSLVTLNFSGVQKITLTNGTKYCVSLCFSGGSSGNVITAGSDNTSPTHEGNYYSYFGSYAATSGTDNCFYVYKDGSSLWKAVTKLQIQIESVWKTIFG